MPLSVNQFKQSSLVEVSSVMIVWVVDSLIRNGLLQTVNLYVKLPLVDVHISFDSQKALKFLLFGELFNHGADTLSNERNRECERRAIDDLFGHAETDFDRENVLGSDDLVNEVGKLLWLDEVLEQLVVEERNYFIYQLKSLDSELRIDHDFVHVENPRQNNLSQNANSALIFILNLIISLLHLKLLLHNPPLQMRWQTRQCRFLFLLALRAIVLLVSRFLNLVLLSGLIISFASLHNTVAIIIILVCLPLFRLLRLIR